MKQIFRHKETILKLIVGIALILVVFHFVDFNELIDSVIHINPIYILAILALIFADRILMVCKWNPLLNALEIHAPFGLLLQLYIVSPVVGNFISGAGAELFRAYGVSKGRADVESVLASIVIERALGLFAMLFLVLISLFLASYLLTAKLTILSNFWWIPGMSALVLIVISLFFFYSKDLSDTLKVTLLKLPVIRNIYKIGVFIRKYRYHYRTIIIVFVLTFLEQLVPILMSDLLALSINVKISILELTAIVPIIVMVGRLPISFNGIGVEEGAAVALYSMVGITPAEAILMSSVGRIIDFAATLPICIHYLLTSRRRSSSVRSMI